MRKLSEIEKTVLKDAEIKLFLATHQCKDLLQSVIKDAGVNDPKLVMQAQGVLAQFDIVDGAHMKFSEISQALQNYEPAEEKAKAA